MRTNRTFRRIRAAVLAGATIAGLVAGASPSPAVQGFELTRLAGIDRYATAAAIATNAFPGGADAAVIARGDAFPDALAGAYLAGVVSAPILLTETDEAPQETQDAVESLGAETVYLLGGTGAISEDVEDDFGDVEVVRIAGDDRYATAAAVATADVEGAAVGELDGSTTAILASGQAFPDALAAGPIAFAGNHPILLTPTASLSPAASGAMDALGIEHVVIVGGTAAVSPAVVSAVEAGGRTTERVAGTDRYLTAVAIADFAAENMDGWTDNAVDLASGANFPDALAGGAASGAANRSIVLTTPTQLSPATADYLEDHSSTLVSGRIFGGTAAVSAAVEEAAEEAGAGTVRVDEGEVVRVDTSTNTYTHTVGGNAVTVNYADSDTFTVDGATSTVANFEANINPGDRLSRTGTRHALTNVAPAAINNRTAGNVDLADDLFDFINDVTGDAIRSNIDYADAAYTVDGATADQAAFEADLNEGDVVQIGTSGGSTVFQLTNRDVSGPANDITVSSPDPITRFKIGPYGDDHAASEDDTLDSSSTADSFYTASGRPGSTDQFTGEAETYSEFASQLTPGDEVTYSRKGGVQTFRLSNQQPTAPEGDFVDGSLDDDGDPSPLSDAGGEFEIVTDDGPDTCTYEGTANTFFVDGTAVTEEQFEQALSAGDDVTCREADDATGTTQRLELTNDQPSGTVGRVNTDEDPTVEMNSMPGKSYEILGRDGETVIVVMEYGDETANEYFVDGSQAAQAGFEAALSTGDSIRITIDENTPDDGTDDVTQHRLTDKTT